MTTRNPFAKDLPGYCFDCGVVAVPERGMIRHADVCSKQASNPPSSPVETTDAPEQRPDHTGVIRGADEAEALEEAAYDGWTRDQLVEEILTFISERDFAYAHVDSWKAVLATTNAHVERIATERDEALIELIRLRGRDANHWQNRERLNAMVTERDATIERLWAQLNEATNVPDERLQLPNCGDRP